MRVLGVDPGLANCGYAVVEREAGEVSASSFGVVTTAGAEVAPRLAELALALRRVLRAAMPEVVAVERLFFNANVRTAMSVGQASGVVLLVAAEAGLPVVAYTPPEVKHTITGRGDAPKGQVAYMVAARLGLPTLPQPADASDALAVALCHLLRCSGRGASPAGRDPAAVAAAWRERAAPESPGLARGRAGSA